MIPSCLLCNMGRRAPRQGAGRFLCGGCADLGGRKRVPLFWCGIGTEGHTGPSSGGSGASVMRSSVFVCSGGQGAVWRVQSVTESTCPRRG